MNKEEFEKKISPMTLDDLGALCALGCSSYQTYHLNVARYALEDLIKDGGHSLSDVPGYAQSTTPAKGIPLLIKYIQMVPDLCQSVDFFSEELFGEVQLSEGTDGVQPEVTDSTEKIEESLDNSIDDSTATETEEGQEDVQEPVGGEEEPEGEQEPRSVPDGLLGLLGQFSSLIDLDDGDDEDCDCSAHLVTHMVDYVERAEYSIAHMNGAFDSERSLDGVRREVEEGVRSTLYGLADLKMALARVKHTLADSAH